MPTRTWAIVTALEREIAPTIRLPAMQREGAAALRPPAAAGAAGMELLARVAGPGPDRVIQAMAALCEAQRLEGCVLFGFAGGLDPVCRGGDLVAADAVVDEAGRRFALDGGVPRPANAADRAGRTILSVQRVVTSRAAKAALYARTHAAAVDQESHAAARFAAQRGLRLAVVRGISDPAEADLPPEAAEWVDPAGRTRSAAALAFVLRHPAWAPALWSVGRHSRRAARAFAGVMQAFAAGAISDLTGPAIRMATS